MLVNNPVATLLATHNTLILDGALATELEARGCDLSDSLWSAKVLIENPELIYQVHLDYFNAGAQCAITASYQATPQGFLRRGLDHEQSLALIAKACTWRNRRAATFWLSTRRQPPCRSPARSAPMALIWPTALNIAAITHYRRKK